jgi:hypothetical protein
MAGQLKEVRNRIKSVQSTQQITKAMKSLAILLATAKAVVVWHWLLKDQQKKYC